MCTIKIKDTEYHLDLERALANGIATKVPKMREIRASDVPNGAPVRWSYRGGNKYRNFIMLNNKIFSSGQIVCIDEENYGELSYMAFDYSNVLYEFYDTLAKKWVSQVEGD